MDVYFSVIVFVRYIEQGRARPVSIRNKSTFIDVSVGVLYIRCNMDVIISGSCDYAVLCYPDRCLCVFYF